VTVDWLEKTLAFIENISRQIPCYILQFEKDENLINFLKKEV